MDAHGPLREEVAGAFPMAALAGLAAAVAGGVVWGLIARWSGYEVGFVAWGIGFLVATAVLVGARGGRGLRYQLAAVVLALLGILIGKYLGFAWTLAEIVEEEGITGVSFPVFSRDTWDAFMDARGEVWSVFDLLWIGLAVFTAFRIPAILRAEPADEPAGPAT
ncbi:MAG: hypothetical protein ICV67_02625 [Thermoleophilia bacterium]|nr:hypothetical protein [Thermoleophilia bacterium]